MIGVSLEITIEKIKLNSLLKAKQKFYHTSMCFFFGTNNITLIAIKGVFHAWWIFTDSALWAGSVIGSNRFNTIKYVLKKAKNALKSASKYKKPYPYCRKGKSKFRLLNSDTLLNKKTIHIFLVSL